MIQRTHSRLYPLVSPPDELPEGVPAPADAVARRQDGRVVAGASARALGKRGGLAKARRRRDLAGYGSTLGLGRMLAFVTEGGVEPFVREGEAWLAEQLTAVARDVGGGQCSPGVVSVLRTASWQRLFAAYLFDVATRSLFHWDVHERNEKGEATRASPRVDLLAMATRLGDSSRQNLLAAHELAAREAAARPRTSVDFAADMRRRILGEAGK